MHALFWLSAIPLLLIAAVVLHPNTFRPIVAELKRHWRLHLIRRYGQKAYQDLAARFRALASRQGYDQKMVEEILRGAETELNHRLGEREANARLGEPTPLERYH